MIGAHGGQVFENVSQKLDVENDVLDGESSIGSLDCDGVGHDEDDPEDDPEEELQYHCCQLMFKRG